MVNQQSYTIVLVDDESEVRKRIASKIPEDGIFSIVGEAANGFDALELIDKFKPNVVITDIRMPYIDGIELSKLIRKNYPKTKIAFISGYDEFAYAKEAIDLDVISYLSKPVSDEEVLLFLEKLKKSLDEEHQQVFNKDRIDQMYKESLPILIENQFNIDSLIDLEMDSIIYNTEEEKIRKAARLINEKGLQYKQRYTDKDTQDFVAMAALQFVITLIDCEDQTDSTPFEQHLKDLSTELGAYLKKE